MGGIWERIDQHPLPPYMHGVVAVPWPDAKTYGPVQNAIDLLEESHDAIRNEAIDLPLREASSPIVARGSWRSHKLNCTSRHAASPQICNVLAILRHKVGEILLAQLLLMQPG